MTGSAALPRSVPPGELEAAWFPHPLYPSAYEPLAPPPDPRGSELVGPALRSSRVVLRGGSEIPLQAVERAALNPTGSPRGGLYAPSSREAHRLSKELPPR